MTTTVNVEYDHLIKLPQKEDMSDPSKEADRVKFFDLMIDKFQWHGRNFSIMEMHPCARYACLPLPDFSFNLNYSKKSMNTLNFDKIL
jgi:hypothetical protein